MHCTSLLGLLKEFPGQNLQNFIPVASAYAFGRKPNFLKWELRLRPNVKNTAQFFWVGQFGLFFQFSFLLSFYENPLKVFGYQGWDFLMITLISSQKPLTFQPPVYILVLCKYIRGNNLTNDFFQKSGQNSKLYIPSTINTWKKPLCTAIWKPVSGRLPHT